MLRPTPVTERNGTLPLAKIMTRLIKHIGFRILVFFSCVLAGFDLICASASLRVPHKSTQAAVLARATLWSSIAPRLDLVKTSFRPR